MTKIIDVNSTNKRKNSENLKLVQNPRCVNPESENASHFWIPDLTISFLYTGNTRKHREPASQSQVKRQRET